MQKYVNDWLDLVFKLRRLLLVSLGPAFRTLRRSAPEDRFRMPGVMG